MRKVIQAIRDLRTEESNLLKFILSLNLPAGHKILDVGCGFGKKMTMLSSHGFEVVGVEANPNIVEANRNVGLNCLSVGDFDQSDDTYDVLLMSHVIEHFQPGELLKFMDHYLDRLKCGGHLIIVTPLYSSYFYDDFDHVKPYHPMGIEMVFGSDSAQVQYYSRNKIDLVDLWFRRGPFKFAFARGLYFDRYSSIPAKANTILEILFNRSRGLIGRIDGWMGLYKKI